MTGVTIDIDAFVDPAERPAIGRAAERLRECLNTVTGQAWRVDVRFIAALSDIAPSAVILASLLTEVDGAAEPIEDTATRWRETIKQHPDPGSVYLLTIFRHVSGTADRWHGTTPRVAIERIRRLNLLAAELSQQTGATVIDIDRVFAHAGARALQAHYRIGSDAAAAFAAQVIAKTMLAAGLGELLEPEQQQQAGEIMARFDVAATDPASAVSAASLRFAKTDGQSFASIEPPLIPSTTRELLRDVRQRRATISEVTPLIWQKVLRHLSLAPK